MVSLPLQIAANWKLPHVHAVGSGPSDPANQPGPQRQVRSLRRSHCHAAAT